MKARMYEDERYKYHSLIRSSVEANGAESVRVDIFYNFSFHFVIFFYNLSSFFLFSFLLLN